LDVVLKLVWSVVWRVIAGFTFLGSLGISVLVMLGLAIGGRNNVHLCDSLTPEEVLRAAPTPENVEVGVSTSYWPLASVCNWRGGEVVRSLALNNDWTYTYWFYGGLLATFLTALIWITAEILLSRRRRGHKGVN
jgi:hypothetical protein